VRSEGKLRDGCKVDCGFYELAGDCTDDRDVPSSLQHHAGVFKLKGSEANHDNKGNQPPARGFSYRLLSFDRLELGGE